MSSEVVVVKRSRRRAFALLWAVPAWLRSVAAGARSLFDAQAPSDLSPRAASLSASAVGIGAWEDAAAMRAPALIFSEADEHACTACQRCVEICPSQCLAVDGRPEATGGAELQSFDLDLARCIGCGDCIAVCPEGALRGASTPLYALSGAHAGADAGVVGLKRDLLSARAGA